MNSGKQYQKGPLAQLVEQLAFNQLVEGSNPSRPTTLLVVKMEKVEGRLVQLMLVTKSAVGFTLNYHIGRRFESFTAHHF